MEISIHNLSDQYSNALHEYLNGSGEEALLKAYELGRWAVTEGVTLLDMVATAYKVSLDTCMPDASSTGERPHIDRIGNFLLESLSAYELTHRSYSDANAALRGLNQIVEEEIKRVAYALHDDASQLLAAAHIELGESSRNLPEHDRKRIRNIRMILEQLGEQLRQISHELYPSILDDFGLVPAIEFLASGLSRRDKLTIAVKGSLQNRIPQAAETAVYRIVQESLVNVIRHSKANRAEVLLELQNNNLLCVVRDDGIGFDNLHSPGTPTKQGQGLRSIRERVHALGGTLIINSKPQAGVELKVNIPISAMEVER